VKLANKQLAKSPPTIPTDKPFTLDISFGDRTTPIRRSYTDPGTEVWRTSRGGRELGMKVEENLVAR
jgi:hypothetical protein